MTAEFAERLLDDVGLRLTRWSHEREAAGSRPTPDDEMRQGEALLADALEEVNRQRLAAGADPLDPDESERLIGDVRARLFGFGVLDHLLIDPTIENLHANGCDRVFITRAGGQRSAGPPLAASDGELIELIRRVA